jgi:hypothetical protein
MTKTEKLTIAQNICAPLLKKIKDDLQRNALLDDDSVHRLDYRYTTGTVYILGQQAPSYFPTLLHSIPSWPVRCTVHVALPT